MKNIVESNTNLKAQISFSKTQLQLCNHDYMNFKKNILEGGREAKVKFQFKLYPTKSKDNPNRYLWKSMLQNAHGGVFSGGWL